MLCANLVIPDKLGTFANSAALTLKIDNVLQTARPHVVKHKHISFSCHNKQAQQCNGIVFIDYFITTLFRSEKNADKYKGSV